MNALQAEIARRAISELMSSWRSYQCCSLNEKLPFSAKLLKSQPLRAGSGEGRGGAIQGRSYTAGVGRACASFPHPDSQPWSLTTSPPSPPPSPPNAPLSQPRARGRREEKGRGVTVEEERGWPPADPSRSRGGDGAKATPSFRRSGWPKQHPRPKGENQGLPPARAPQASPPREPRRLRGGASAPADDLLLLQERFFPSLVRPAKAVVFGPFRLPGLRLCLFDKIHEKLDWFLEN